MCTWEQTVPACAFALWLIYLYSLYLFVFFKLHEGFVLSCFGWRAYDLKHFCEANTAMQNENESAIKSCVATSHLLGLKSPLEEAQKRSKAEAVHVVDL